MFDICSIFKNLQKLFQKSNLILPDALTAKDSAVEHLKIMKDLPIPGGKGSRIWRIGTRVTVIGRPEKQRQPTSSFQVEAETAMP